jgi:hypothetical protein
MSLKLNQLNKPIDLTDKILSFNINYSTHLKMFENIKEKDIDIILQWCINEGDIIIYTDYDIQNRDNFNKYLNYIQIIDFLKKNHREEYNDIYLLYNKKFDDIDINIYIHYDNLYKFKILHNKIILYKILYNIEKNNNIHIIAENKECKTMLENKISEKDTLQRLYNNLLDEYNKIIPDEKRQLFNALNFFMPFGKKKYIKEIYYNKKFIKYYLKNYFLENN